MKPASSLTPKARRTRAALVNAARNILGTKGVSGLTVMAVCDAADVGRTSFYNYFPDVDSLVESVGTTTAEGIKTDFDDLHAEMPRGLDRLRRCLTMVLRIAADDPETALLLTSLAMDSPTISDLLRHEIKQELMGAVKSGSLNLNRTRAEHLAHHLTLTTLATCREIARGTLSGTQIDEHVGFMMRASGAN